ncbi:predicted protein [Pyrenophora tritici-repentis Pt-1C-BFP]|uniref:Uncharacterized protein n=1 Tax=Pyrenophora tritici-repentis (strain Pt-1C-BFP) TaxID=426418 RepID=B2VUS1_PYRTR|nr:uncharacterized protein PTRG_02175 [Pyrenophora tritici-repentis Pt-1C-BFP]EDU41613.1 predicted protein [Pyrenophora tritici-repentis Pt-1C-BFP]
MQQVDSENLSVDPYKSIPRSCPYLTCIIYIAKPCVYVNTMPPSPSCPFLHVARLPALIIGKGPSGPALPAAAVRWANGNKTTRKRRSKCAGADTVS